LNGFVGSGFVLPAKASEEEIMPVEFQDGDTIYADHLKQYSGEAYYSEADVGSTTSAYLATVTPAPLSGYPTGMVVNFKPDADNAAAPTLNVNGMGAKAIVKEGSTALAADDMKAGQIVSLIYDGTNFQMAASGAGGGAPSTSFGGIVCSKTSSQSISSNTLTDVTFTIERVAETAHISHSVSTDPDEFTINTEGNYRISGRLAVTPASTGDWVLILAVLDLNGNSIAQARGASYAGSYPGATGDVTFDWVYALEANDVIKIQAFCSSRGLDVLGLSGTVDQTTLCIEYLGE